MRTPEKKHFNTCNNIIKSLLAKTREREGGRTAEQGHLNIKKLFDHSKLFTHFPPFIKRIGRRQTPPSHTHTHTNPYQVLGRAAQLKSLFHWNNCNVKAKQNVKIQEPLNLWKHPLLFSQYSPTSLLVFEFNFFLQKVESFKNTYRGSFCSWLQTATLEGTFF